MCMFHLLKDPNDQSAWIYEKWLLLEHQRSKIKEIKYDATSTVLELTLATVPAVNLSMDLIHLKVNGVYFKLNNADKNSLTWTSTNANNCWQTKLDECADSTHVHSKLIESLREGAHGELKLEVAIRNAGNAYEILVEKDASFLSNVYAYKSKFEMRNAGLDDTALIAKHLASLVELSSLEADKSKWCLLTLVEIMTIVDFDKHKATVFKYLDELTHIDVYRKNFYLDLKQKIISNNNFLA